MDLSVQLTAAAAAATTILLQARRSGNWSSSWFLAMNWLITFPVAGTLNGWSLALHWQLHLRSPPSCCEIASSLGDDVGGWQYMGVIWPLFLLRHLDLITVFTSAYFLVHPLVNWYSLQPNNFTLWWSIVINEWDLEEQTLSVNANHCNICHCIMPICFFAFWTRNGIKCEVNTECWWNYTGQFTIGIEQDK